MENKTESKRLLLILTAVFILCFIGSFLFGRYRVAPDDLFGILVSQIVPMEQSWETAAQTVVLKIRLPRVLAAAVVGAGLSLAGICYQGLFGNPMASPDLLGASAGAGFGASAGILLGFSYWSISLTAFGCGIAAVILAQIAAAAAKTNRMMGLVLGGIIISSLFSAGTSLLKLLADPTDTLPAITYWLMGSLASVKTDELLFAMIPIAVGSSVLLTMRWKLNVLTLGDEEAKSLGINVSAIRFAVILCATLITAACVSISGMIGWVGLVIPHLVRMIAGSDYRITIPSSLLLGASFMMLADSLARSLATIEIPLGILTSFVGAPFFLYLMTREGTR